MTGPHPAVARARTAVRTALADLSPGDRVLVACSGGPDSLALAAATAFVAPRAGLLAGAVVVDHGWFDGSAQVALRAAGQCRELGLDPVPVLTLGPPVTPGGSGSGGSGPGGSGPGGNGGPEAAARTARYQALDATAERLGARAVLLGHTRDDQAETVLLGLVRGSGARSLAGMPAVRGIYRRPFLDLPATHTREVCARLGLEPWQDPANADPAYTRSRLRAVLARVRPDLAAALGGDLDAALARTAALLAEDAEALEGFAAQLLAAAREPEGSGPSGSGPSGSGSGSGSAALSCERLAQAPDAVRRRALLLALREAGAPAGSLGRRHVLAVDALVVRWRGQGVVHLPGGVSASRACGRLLLGSRAGDDDRPAEGAGE